MNLLMRVYYTQEGWGMADSVFEALTKSFQARGRRIASCEAARAKEVEERIQALLRDGLMDRRVHDAYFDGMRFHAPAAYGTDASILIAATPHYRSVLVLELPDGVLETTIPSTYLADRIKAENDALLVTVLGPLGLRFEPAALPLKTLAAWTALGAYGRDNVLRVEGMGSYARLDAWWVDADLGEAGWGPPRVLARCAACRACLRACPNGCFHDEGFLVDASRCLTFLNEGSEDLPRWLPAGAHTAAIGCLRCQEACPENARHRRAVERRYTFDAATSQALLEGKPAGALSPEAGELIRLLELEGREQRLARNLSALLRQRQASGAARGAQARP